MKHDLTENEMKGKRLRRKDDLR